MNSEAAGTGENGFTLIELIVGIAILGSLMTAIGSALIVGLRTTDATNQRFSESHDAQMSSAYLANDVQSARSVSVPSSGANCSGGSTPLISFGYAGGQTAAYSCGMVEGETRVTRSFAGSSVVVAHFAGASRPSITCTPSCGATSVNSVKIAFTEVSGYAYTLLGSRRAFTTGGGGGVPSTPDLTFLAMGNSPLQIKGKCTGSDVHDGTDGCTTVNPDNAKLVVNGNLSVNSATVGAVKVTGGGGKGFLLSTTGAFKILAGGTCSGCNSGNTNPYPPGSYSPALADPLRFMSEPTSSTTGSCSGSVCSPGVYAGALTINSDRTLQPGVYIFKNGLSVQGNANVTGTGVTIFIKGGSLSFAGGSSVNLTPSSTGPYKGILVYQSRTNSSALSLSGGTNLNTAQFLGVVYAPLSVGVTLGTGGAFMHVTAVIAQNVTVTGNSQVTIG